VSRLRLAPATARAAERRTASKGLPWHVQQNVRFLLTEFAKEGERPLRQPKPSAASKLGRDPASCPTSDPAKLPSLCEPSNRNRTVAGVPCHSFEAVLKMYYKTPEQVEAMLTFVEPEFVLVERKRWIRRMRESCTDQIRQAFLMGDGDDDGGLSLDEFLAAVETHAGKGAANKERVAKLTAAFAEADVDGNGTLDFDEFLELVARHPVLVDSFEQILAIGCEKRRRLEQYRQTIIFRSCMSPTTHAAVSPSGRRRRPNLFDLRLAHEVRLPLPFDAEPDAP